MKNRLAFFLGLVLLAFIVTPSAFAAVTNAGVLDNVLDRYQRVSSSWGSVMTKHGTILFWILVAISMAWTFGMMALRKADIAEFFAEFIRFTLFTGFFFWLLVNGPRMATDIIDSMRAIGGEASGTGAKLSPSGIIDIGFDIFFKILDQSSVWKPVDSACGMVLGAVVLFCLALVAINMLLLLISGWVLAYGGAFFLGFGGSRWTSEMAINYYKTVLGVGASLMAMTLLVGIGKSFIDEYYASMSSGLSLKELAVMAVAAVVIYKLTNGVPSMIAGLAGGNVGAAVANVGGGQMLGAAALAAGAVATGGAMAMSAASNVAGGASALRAAFTAAQENMANGTGMFSGSGGGSDGSAAGGKNSGKSSLAAAMGDGQSGSSNSKGTGAPDESGSPSSREKASGDANATDSGKAEKVADSEAVTDKLEAAEGSTGENDFSPAEAEQAGAFSEDAIDESALSESPPVDGEGGQPAEQTVSSSATDAASTQAGANDSPENISNNGGSENAAGTETAGQVADSAAAENAGATSAGSQVAGSAGAESGGTSSAGSSDNLADSSSVAGSAPTEQVSASAKVDGDGGQASAGNAPKSEATTDSEEMRSQNSSNAGGKSKLRTAGLLAADTGLNLAKGAADMARAKVKMTRDNVSERIGKTIGGKLAKQITANSEAQSLAAKENESFGANSIGKGTPEDEEVQAFVNKNQA